MNNLFKWDWFNNSGGGSPYTPFPTVAGKVLLYDSSYLATQLQEQGVNTIPITPVAADADKVGIVYDLATHGFYTTAPSTATRPALGSDSENFSYWDFTAASSHRLQCINTASYLKPIHKQSTTFSIATRVKKKTDGTVQTLFSNQTSTTAQIGIYVSVTAANKISILIAFGTGGQSRASYTSTQGFTVADGWKDIIITVNGTSGHLIIGSVDEAFVVNTAGAEQTGNATGDMILGGTPAGSIFFNGYMTHFLVTNTVLSAGEITDIKAYHPTRNTQSWSNTIYTFNFSNTAKGWADTGKTTPITNGTAFRAWEPNETSVFGPLNRDLTTASAGVSPIYNTGLENGIAGCTWDGTDDNAVLTDRMFNESGGMGGFLIVAKNTRAALGSHYFQEANYFVVTGSTYPSGALGVGNTYTVIHPGGADPGQALNPQKNNGEFTNVVVVQRDKTSFSCTNGSKAVVTGTSVNQMRFTNMGTPSNAGWNLQGNVMKVIYWRGVKTQAEIDALIDTENTTYAI